MVSVTAVLVIIAFVCVVLAKVLRQPTAIDLTWLAVLLLAIVHLLNVIVVGIR